MGKTVHVVSSNIKLANRDYEESLPYFSKIKQKSAVFLHKNERKFNGEYEKLPKEIRAQYPKDLFGEDLFDNSLNMYIKVNDNAKIIFTTLPNLQFYYLWYMSHFPGEANKYFNKCYLLIDEADSILIDELSNGAILSRSIKTNSSEVLKHVYENRNKPEEVVLDEIKKLYPNCAKFTINNIKDMYHEIDIVNDENFCIGKKYQLEEVVFEENDELLDLYQKYKDESIKEEFLNAIKNLVDKVKTKLKNKNKLNFENKEKITLRRVVPFDSENKGIYEKNKEFSGFIQQFIAIKENLNNKECHDKVIIKDCSMNYMYVSHPFFIKLYKGVCGFTGTIGENYEENIYNSTYEIETKIIPRENTNHRVDLPIIICKENEKHNLIYKEIKKFHLKKYPVLVIFQNSEELRVFKEFLEKNGVNNLNVFNGKDENYKPDEIAGIDGAISIGTNVCGRGVNIKVRNNPLHVIVAYYTANSRIIYQALGRTARQGQKGTTRIICTNKEYLASRIIFKQEEINKLINIFDHKKKLMTNFIDHFKETRGWILNHSIGKQIINNENICKMRESLINVNRYKACNFEFPVCMDVETFLRIQVQKIYSLYSLPNCENTWMIFQRYIREMIFYSFSLMIENADKEMQCRCQKHYYDYYLEEYNKLIKLLQVYLPEKDPSKMDILSTFMHIFNYVTSEYKSNACASIPNWLYDSNKQFNSSKFSFVSLSVGFRPYSVNVKSEKVDTINGEDQSYHSIRDPELKFYQQKHNQSRIRLSITKKIDQLFNEMCKKINEVIESTIGLQFFLRRTLGGCEFGICYDFGIMSNNSESNDEFTTLVDKDPLFLFSINVKSTTNAPILAGILIFCLVYIAYIAKKILEFIMDPSKMSFKSLKFIIKEIIKAVKGKINEKAIEKVIGTIKEKINEKTSELFDPIFENLTKIAKNQIDRLSNEKVKFIFSKILGVIDNDETPKICEKINEFFEGKTILNIKKINIDITADFFPVEKFFKLGVLLIICISSFMMNFNSHRSRIKYDEERVARKFNQDQNVSRAIQENRLVVEDSYSNTSLLDVSQPMNNTQNCAKFHLTINVIQATDVPKMDIITWCDPYVVIKISDSKIIGRTDIKYNTKNPIWNQSFGYLINSNDYKNESLIFKMIDYDENSKDDFISKIKMPLCMIPISTPFEKWFDMNPGKRTFGKGGKLKVSFFIKKME